MSEFADQWLKDTWEKYSAAQRLAFLLIALMAGVYFTTFQQFLHVRKQLREAHDNTETLKIETEHIKQVCAAVKELDLTTQTILDGAIDNIVTDLQDNFAALDVEIEKIQNPGAVVDQGDEILNTPLQVSVLPAKPTFSPEAIAELKKILEEQDLVEESLDPFVEKNVLATRFAEASKNWQSESAPKLQQLVLAAEKAFSALSADSLVRFAALAQLKSQIAAFEPAVMKVSFVAPPGDWWRSKAEKVAQGERLKRRLKQALASASMADAALAIEELSNKSKLAAEAAEAKLNETLKELEESFAKQKQQSESLAKPFAFLALDLAYIAPRFPLLLGIVLASAIFWPAWRKRDLNRARMIFAQESNGEKSIYFSGSPLPGWCFPVAVAAAIAWVIISGMEVKLAKLEDSPNELPLILGGILFIGAASWFSWSVARQESDASRESANVQPRRK